MTRRLAANRILATAMTTLAVMVVAWPTHAQAGGDTAAVDPAATAALDRMGVYLRTLKAFQVEAATAREEVLDNGLKAQFEGRVTFLARMPDRLRVDVENDRQERQYLYDGTQFTLWARRVNYYATVAAPPTVSALDDFLDEKYGIEVPLADLFRWGAGGSSSADITAAVDLGPGVVGGTTCQHYAFRQEGLDWQIWIQKGDFPLPRKVVLTTTTDEARPQFQATYTWNLAPSFNDAAFAFDPPADARRIVFAETPAPSSASK